MIHLDTSVLVDALTGPGRSLAALRSAVSNGERLAVSTLVLYEWLRGPRQPAELRWQENLFPRHAAIPFDGDAAARASALYSAARRPRNREIDIAIAACALVQGAALWTLNRGDFEDLPGLMLYDAASDL